MLYTFTMPGQELCANSLSLLFIQGDATEAQVRKPGKAGYTRAPA
jgi:hypothetical protein